jgi:hypothetical protein
MGDCIVEIVVSSLRMSENVLKWREAISIASLIHMGYAIASVVLKRFPDASRLDRLQRNSHGLRGALGR